MKPEEFFKTRGFSPAWLEDTEAKTQEEERVETVQQRKDLDVLLSELKEIKNEFSKISERKENIQNSLRFYSKFLLN